MQIRVCHAESRNPSFDSGSFVLPLTFISNNALHPGSCPPPALGGLAAHGRGLRLRNPEGPPLADRHLPAEVGHPALQNPHQAIKTSRNKNTKHFFAKIQSVNIFLYLQEEGRGAGERRLHPGDDPAVTLRGEGALDHGLP